LAGIAAAHERMAVAVRVPAADLSEPDAADDVGRAVPGLFRAADPAAHLHARLHIRGAGDDRRLGAAARRRRLAALRPHAGGLAASPSLGAYQLAGFLR